MGRTARKRRRNQSVFIRTAAVRQLYSWIVSNGFRPAKCDLRLAVTSSGRGMVCRGPVCPGDVIVDLPETLLITACKVRSMIPNLPEEFSVEEVLAVFIIIKSRCGSCSFWTPYINSLPKHFDSPLTYCQIDRLPKGVQRAFDSWHAKAFRSWHRLSNYFQLSGKSLSESEFAWSWCAVNTRCIFVEGHGSALAPFLDMLNHHWTASVHTEFKDGHFVISSDCPYDPGSEVFISYGSHDNRTLLRDYGFVLDDNPNDCVRVERDHLDSLHALRQFCHFDEKIRLINDWKLLSDQTGFTSDGATWNLKVVLTILEDCASSCEVDWKLHLVKSREEADGRELESVLAGILLNDYPNALEDFMLNKLVQIEKEILRRCLNITE